MRKVETSESFDWGKVLLPESVREKIAQQQVEIVAVGASGRCVDDDCARPHRSDGLHPFPGKPGDWAVIAPRSLTESGDDGLYLVAQEDVIALLSV